MKALLAAGAVLAVTASAPAATPERLTLFAQPSVAGAEQAVVLSGTVATGRIGETIEIEARDCGQRTFRHAVSAHIGRGGGWSIHYAPGITTTLRAVRGGVTSPSVTVRQRAPVRLAPLPGSSRRFQVAVVARASLWRKRALIQRFARGRWVTARRVVLTDSGANARSPVVWSTAKFTLAVPKGTLLRAVLPLTQARPCYLAGTSNSLRT